MTPEERELLLFLAPYLWGVGATVTLSRILVRLAPTSGRNIALGVVVAGLWPLVGMMILWHALIVAIDEAGTEWVRRGRR